MLPNGNYDQEITYESCQRKVISTNFIVYKYNGYIFSCSYEAYPICLKHVDVSFVGLTNCS